MGDEIQYGLGQAGAWPDMGTAGRSQQDVFGYPRQEKSACGVGLIASLTGKASHQILTEGLYALSCVEHRGACAADGQTGDGAGIMTDIPFGLLGYAPGTVAVASIFVTPEPDAQKQLIELFEQTFGFWDMPVLAYREVPIEPSVLGPQARAAMPRILHAIIQRPIYANTDNAFNQMLYLALRKTFTRQRRLMAEPLFFVSSLSANTLVYKGLTRAENLSAFYPDLQRAEFCTRFVLFHRRFSTNTISSWDKAQPFRLLAHNGEINTLHGNRSWAYSREKTLGLPRNELLTHEGISDSGSLNEMAEALMYRSSLPYVEDALALLIPPYDLRNPFYKFWSRAMEPWDGPALVAFSDGELVGARLDRNGFRPCRWAQTRDHFYLASEAGVFNLNNENLVARGCLRAGHGVQVELSSGRLDFADPSEAQHNINAIFDPRLYQLGYIPPRLEAESLGPEKPWQFLLTREALEKMLTPMIREGKEPIGSMGDTARLAILSDQPRSFFDYFYQNFAQVTNPPLDYLREKMVTDLSVYLGPRPNIINQKELIPPPVGIELPSPLLSLGQLDYLTRLGGEQTQLQAKVFPMVFRREYGGLDFRHRLENLAAEVVEAVRHKTSIIILSDRSADWEHLPMPVLIVLRRVIMALDKAGLRLRASLVVDSGQIHSTHHVACVIGCGAAALCPWLALQLACSQRFDDSHGEKGDPKGHSKAAAKPSLTPADRERNLLKAFEGGLLKVMSKMGISVVSSYMSSKLFTIVGLDKIFSHLYFRGVPSLVGGLTLEDIISRELDQAEQAQAACEKGELLHTYLFREHNKHQRGEKHAMSALRSRLLHQALTDNEPGQPAYVLYRDSLYREAPYHLRHLLRFRPAADPLELAAVEPLAGILTRFGSGAMSFGAISAESQRDLILAMQAIGGRSNSGEGGENPYYQREGISASIKQVASGRFGVSARYLSAATEIQIKVAQGAKPGEGGQLMAVKVDADIARARHSLTGVDLISPPPLHDIYSIEDLKELIYTLKQLRPDARVSVKLVSGAQIGTIAVGVAKAGADIIHVSGADGGTGAATLSSMKHTGLPFEPGLAEVHHALCDNQLRGQITLRVDGGLHSGQDVVLAALLGADEFDFGKLLLVAQGCIMARVCEKNTCPTGIATQDPRFKARYTGSPEAVIRLLELIGAEVRQWLAELGVASLEELIGRTDLLEVDPRHQALVSERRLDLSCLLRPGRTRPARTTAASPLEAPAVNRLNARLLADCRPAIESQQDLTRNYLISSRDRAILATLAGELALQEHLNHLHALGKLPTGTARPYQGSLSLNFTGSAGQGFAAFACDGLKVRLVGEANDSVAKSMSGGKVVLCPPPEARLRADEDVILGNCALYGATGGTLYACGMAGDRFAVRNSGAVSVVEGAGFHACEYMTHGCVVILGPVGKNLGGGMTGGRIYLLDEQTENVNQEYIAPGPLEAGDEDELKAILADYLRETASPLAESLLSDWPVSRRRFVKYIPVRQKSLKPAEKPH
ncbi:MAG: glutamate synthase large subunit [Candidatus Sericytochromatia bacterium]